MNENSLKNLIPNMGKGRPKGSKNKVRFGDVITDDMTKHVIQELYDIAMTDKYAKNRLTAIGMILDRNLGKIAVEVHQTFTDTSTLQDLLTEDESADGE